ncbi:hypothetical protein [Bradyrhizobium sp. Ash2021]|uniref:hypothetical protein n=1 Tax=Bradyrhizobium sp. Ash2021 TaxID=2954771 RepID=UPI002814E2F2|nr:hypothetical protein [Bradyrhizobium sp. Ash2021]WMT79158.1 hypothetical protein NL528_32440 [Bradyrhizobium sp. Ash2021]
MAPGTFFVAQSWADFITDMAGFNLRQAQLYGLLLLHHDRRQILWLGVTAHPTAEWISHQLTEAYGWKVAPRYIIRDRDAVYGDVVIRRLRAMSIRDRPTAARGSHAPFGQQGRAVAANSTCRWSHFAYAISRRTSSSVCASLISDRHSRLRTMLKAIE